MSDAEGLLGCISVFMRDTCSLEGKDGFYSGFRGCSNDVRLAAPWALTVWFYAFVAFLLVLCPL